MGLKKGGERKKNAEPNAAREYQKSQTEKN